jgi:hypothetical protein
MRSMVNMSADENRDEPEDPIPSDPESLDEEELRQSPDSDEIQGQPDRKKEEWHNFETP